LTNTIYLTDGFEPGNVSVISGQTNTVVATVPVGNFPRGPATDPLTGTIYVANLLDGTVSVLGS
jgi:YVTN family beta-propeller protein